MQNGNLGVAAARDDFDAAVDYFNQALARYEELGRKEGMALIYANLGAVAFKRGDLLEARQFWVQARGLFAEMGVQPKVAQSMNCWPILNRRRGHRAGVAAAGVSRARAARQKRCEIPYGWWCSQGNCPCARRCGSACNRRHGIESCRL